MGKVVCADPSSVDPGWVTEHYPAVTGMRPLRACKVEAEKSFGRWQRELAAIVRDNSMISQRKLAKNLPTERAAAGIAKGFNVTYTCKRAVHTAKHGKLARRHSSPDKWASRFQSCDFHPLLRGKIQWVHNNTVPVTESRPQKSKSEHQPLKTQLLFAFKRAHKSGRRAFVIARLCSCRHFAISP